MKKILIIITICLILITGNVIAKPGQFLYTKSLQTNVYKTSNGKNVLFIVALGRKVIEFEKVGEYVHVGIAHMKGHDGWIKSSDLSETDPDGLKW